MKRIGYGIVLALLALGTMGAAYAQMPSPPLNLTAKEAPQLPLRVDLHWTGMIVLPPVSLPPISAGAYRIYRSVDDSLSFKALNTTMMTDYADLQVVAGHTYYYYVSTLLAAIDSIPRESGRSNIAWVTVVPPGGEKTGTIAGTVTDSLTGKPIPYASVTFYRPVSPVLWLPRTVADSAGRYTAVLDTGTYLLLCDPPALMGRLAVTPVAFPLYRPKWYRDAYDPAHATPVGVTDGGTFTADFALARFVLPTPVHVRGTVRDSAGGVLKGARVVIMRTVQEMHQFSALGEPVLGLPGQTLALGPIGVVQGVVWTGRTDSSGTFDASVLSQHSYIAMASDSGYLPQFYDHKSTPLEATQIAVTGDVSGIDFNLLPWRPPQMYTISGVVRDSSGVRVPSRIVVFPLRSPRAVAARFAFSDSLGAYMVDHLLAGKYIVLAVPFADYAPAFYKAGAYGVMRWKDADTVTVAANVAGIDIGVVQIHGAGVATLTGTVTSSGGGPLEGVNVLVQDETGAAVGYGMTDATGAYQIDALPAGALTVTADLMGYNGAQQPLGVSPAQYSASQDFALDVTTSVAPGSAAPVSYALLQNYPNPFNPSTKISFSLPQAAVVTLRVFNLLGQQVATLANGAMGAGLHELTWEGRDSEGRGLASGVYFYRIHVAGPDGTAVYDAIRKMLLLK